jgi:hypothetical protein
MCHWHPLQAEHLQQITHGTMHNAGSSTCDQPIDAARTGTFLQYLSRVCHLSFTALILVQDDVTSVLSVGPAILAGSVDGTLRRFDDGTGRTYTDQLHHTTATACIGTSL